jgi:hypothetical protein
MQKVRYGSDFVTIDMTSMKITLFQTLHAGSAQRNTCIPCIFWYPQQALNSLAD